jgi:hypothetical protein
MLEHCLHFITLLHIYVGSIMMIDFAFMHPIDREILANNNKWDQFMVNFSASIKKSVNSPGVSQGVS